MNRVPEIVPISDLRARQTEILKQIQAGPIVLTQHGKAVSVMIDPEQWNRITDELETLADSVDALAARLELLAGEEKATPWEAVKAGLNVPA
jgi:prevent-host-death family protein